MSSIRNPLHVEIIPGILEKEWSEIEKKIQLVLPFAETIHIDVIDGKFAPNSTWMDPAPFAKYAKSVKFEVHLLTDNPMQYIQAFADAGFVRFVGQIEKMPDQTAFVAAGQLWGEVGLALDGPTPIEQITVDVEDLDVVQLYTGEKAGFSHGILLPEKLEKAKALRAQDPFLPIEIDGGVNDVNIQLAKESGVTRFVTTGFLFGGNVEEQYKKLKEMITFL